MTTFRFKHPLKPDLEYFWNTANGRLRGPEFMHDLELNTNMGEVFHALLMNGFFDTSRDVPPNQQHLSIDSDDVRHCIRKLIHDKLHLNKEERPAFVKNIRNQGYQWLPEVTCIQQERSAPPQLAKINKDTGVVWQSPPPESPLSPDYVNFSVGIDRKLEGFIGRDFVFDRLSRFQEERESGYFVIEGSPGIGKTSLMYRLLQKSRVPIAFFNDGLTPATRCLRGILAQLIHHYGLAYAKIPDHADRDGRFLEEVLAAVSEKLSDGDPCIILIDALDEMEQHNTGPVLSLPRELPKGVFVVMTTRPQDTLLLPSSRNLKRYPLTHDSTDNERDIANYITANRDQFGLPEYLTHWELDFASFRDGMVGKSEGNFMYLVYVLPELGDGDYRQIPVENLPYGLIAYYNDHWGRMFPRLDPANPAQRTWEKNKLRVVYSLLAAREPAGVRRLKNFTEIEDPYDIQKVLSEWRQFLHKTKSVDEWEYRFYHKSYMDFLGEKDEVRVKKGNASRNKEAHRGIADAGIAHLRAKKDFFLDEEDD